MDAFMERHRSQIVGVLSGCDRVLFRGTLRSISYLDGMERLLASYRVLVRGLANSSQRVSDTIKQHAHQLAEKQSVRSSIWSRRPSPRKTSTEHQERDGVEEGLICVLSCVEPCQTYAMKKDREKKHLRLVPARRKCLYSVLLLPGPRIRLDARPPSDVAADGHSGLRQWEGVPGATAGPRGDWLRETGQLFCSDRRPSPGLNG